MKASDVLIMSERAAEPGPPTPFVYGAMSLIILSERRQVRGAATCPPLQSPRQRDLAQTKRRPDGRRRGLSAVRLISRLVGERGRGRRRAAETDGRSRQPPVCFRVGVIDGCLGVCFGGVRIRRSYRFSKPCRSQAPTPPRVLRLKRNRVKKQS